MIVSVVLGGITLQALVDTCCSTILVCSKYSRKANGSFSAVAFDGMVIKCRGKEDVRLGVEDKVVSVEMIVVEKLFGGVDVDFGMDFTNQMGGVSVQQNKVTWGIETCTVGGLPNGRLQAGVNVEPTDTGVYTNFNSHTPLRYTRSVVKTLVKRAIRHSATWELYHAEL